MMRADDVLDKPDRFERVGWWDASLGVALEDNPMMTPYARSEWEKGWRKHQKREYV